MRSYAQDLLLRVASSESAVHHLRLRGRYGGGTGALLVLDASGLALELVLCSGELRVSSAVPAAAAIAESTLVLDPSTRSLRFGESEVRVERPEPQPEL